MKPPKSWPKRPKDYILQTRGERELAYIEFRKAQYKRQERVATTCCIIFVVLVVIALAAGIGIGILTF